MSIANESTIAHGCARVFRAAGAERAVTYLNAKSEPYVRLLADALAASSIGRVAAFLAGEAGAPMTGSVTYADQGFHIVG